MNARFQKLYNDLFWEVFDSKQQKFIKWQGYNDAYWWDNVAISDQFQIRGEYRLDPFTNTVSILTKYAPDVSPVTYAEPHSGLESVSAVESDTQPRG